MSWCWEGLMVNGHLHLQLHYQKRNWSRHNLHIQKVHLSSTVTSGSSKMISKACWTQILFCHIDWLWTLWHRAAYISFFIYLCHICLYHKYILQVPVRKMCSTHATGRVECRNVQSRPVLCAWHFCSFVYLCARVSVYVGIQRFLWLKCKNFRMCVCNFVHKKGKTVWGERQMQTHEGVRRIKTG